MKNPYRTQPPRAFWRRAVSGRGLGELSEIASLPDDLGTARVATGGSCFAQHIGRSMRRRGLRYMDCEPAPSFLTQEEAARFGYNVYSCRYGNIYTVRQLLQLFEEAHGERAPEDWIWRREDDNAVRFFDGLRPGVFEHGLASEEEVRASREFHLARVRDMFATLDIFIFTLGLTEHWRSSVDGTAYPIAPGVIAGTYDPSAYEFANSGFREVLSDLQTFRERLRGANPGARMLLTVSPVPLAATATDEHVLVATTYSKSVLRAAAGEMSDEHEDVFYFPSYELVTGQPTRHSLYAPDLREVTPEGVEQVMRHFFACAQLPEPRAGPERAEPDLPDDFGFEQCEEGLLDEQAP